MADNTWSVKVYGVGGIRLPPLLPGIPPQGPILSPTTYLPASRVGGRNGSVDRQAIGHVPLITMTTGPPPHRPTHRAALTRWFRPISRQCAPEWNHCGLPHSKATAGAHPLFPRARLALCRGVEPPSPSSPGNTQQRAVGQLAR